jgi:hypothetical protein
MCLVRRGTPSPYVAYKILILSYLLEAIEFKIFIAKELSLKILFLKELAPDDVRGFLFSDL